MAVEVAFAASARDWPDRVHRHILDHGGAKVAGRLLGASQCVEAGFDVIFIDDVCSFLSPRLVALLRENGRAVIGVYDNRDSPDAKRRLLECGISDVIESDAEADEFVARARSVAADPLLEPHRPRHRIVSGRAVGVTGVCGGVGATEVAVGLAHCLAPAVSTVLVDLDPHWPSVAQRLDLPPHPNLRALADIVLHQGELENVMNTLGKLSVVAGSPRRGTPDPIPIHELAMSLQVMVERFDVLVADLGWERAVVDSLIEGFDTVIVVSTGDPVGVARLLGAHQWLETLMARAPVLVVVNNLPGGRFQEGEVRSELEAALGGIPYVTIPRDKRLSSAVWQGSPAGRGPFRRELSKLAGLVAGAVTS